MTHTARSNSSVHDGNDNHGSIVEFMDKTYALYHELTRRRRRLSSPRSSLRLPWKKQRSDDARRT